MLECILRTEEERAKAGLPPLPLIPADVDGVCRFLEKPEAGKAEIFLALLRNRISPGVDPAAKVKAGWLARVAQGEAPSPAVSRTDAVFLLGTMLGGYNVEPLVELSWTDRDLAAAAAEALKQHRPRLRRVRGHRPPGRTRIRWPGPSSNPGRQGSGFFPGRPCRHPMS